MSSDEGDSPGEQEASVLLSGSDAASSPAPKAEEDEKAKVGVSEEKEEGESLWKIACVSPSLKNKGLPWKQLAPLCLIQLCETFSSSGIFAYGAFLVKDFTGLPIDAAGFWAGLLPSAAFFGMFLGGLPWGYMSDRFGKKVCLLLGTTASLLTSLGVGFSQNLGMAIGFRLASGLLNGNLGIVKSYLGAIMTKKTQGRAFALIAIVWGAG